MSGPLWPREHGAYAQLGFPLMSGLLLGQPGLPAAGFALSAILFFLAYEPAAILLGLRGPRLRERLASGAGRRLRWLAPAGLLAGVLALATANRETRLLALVPSALALAILPLVLARRAKTLSGEMLVVATCASMHLPVGHASGLREAGLFGPAGLWFAVLGAATLAVHAIKARQEGRGRGVRLAAGASAVLGLGSTLALAVAAAEYRWLGLAALVPMLAITAVNLARLPARHLKRVGWTLVVANLVALGILAAGL